MRVVRAASGAVAFLTRVPVGRIVVLDGTDVARGAIFFPLVGAGIGAVTGLVAIGLHHRVSSLLAAAIAIGASVMLTGALHVDALADTADALGASSRERALEIMRDSRLGSYGAAALAIDLVVKIAAVTQLLDRGGAVPMLVAAGALSRAASLPLATLLRYPREEGSGGVFATGVPLHAALTAPLLACTLAVAVAGVHGLVLIGVVAGSTAALGLAFRTWLGGATGDSLGATIEIGETFALVVGAALV
jgi:adenosylcobinamide-GDP ribazoletransferase